MREWLYEIRKSKNFTMLEVAGISNISESYYSMIENGERNPSVEKAKEIARVLGFDWTRFYESEDKN